MAFRFTSGGPIEAIGELAAGYAIGGAVGTALEPAMQSLRNHVWSLDPSLPVDVGTLATLVRLGRLDLGAAAGEAAHSGVSGDNFARYLAATRTPAGTGELLAMFNRGELSLDELATWLTRGGLDERMVAEYITLARTPLSPAEAALARQQGFIDEAAQLRYASLAGVDVVDAALQFEIVGLPPGIGEGLELLRRGKIDEARFAQYVREGHTKTKYTDDLLELRYQPLSAAIAAELRIRERIGEAEALKIARENGVRDADFITWSDGLGRPIATGEALTLINRGFKGPPDGPEAAAYFREAVARSDVRTEYADDLLHLRIHYPPLFQVQRALEAGTITPALAADTLAKEGYPPEWVDAIVKAHAKGHTAKARDLSAAIIDTLYEAGIYTHPEADKALELLGYDAAEAESHLELWLARRIVSDLVKALGIIERRYVAWKIDRTQAQTLLAELPIPGEVGQRLLPVWDDERNANAPTLTASEVERGFHYGRFTFDEAMQLLQRMGYTLDDSLTKLWITVHGDPRPAPA